MYISHSCSGFSRLTIILELVHYGTGSTQYYGWPPCRIVQTLENFSLLCVYLLNNTYVHFMKLSTFQFSILLHHHVRIFEGFIWSTYIKQQCGLRMSRIMDYPKTLKRSSVSLRTGSCVKTECWELHIPGLLRVTIIFVSGHYRTGS